VGPAAWTFAAVQVRNKPITAPLARRLMRQAAQGCVVDIDFFRWGTEDKVFSTVPGRWSSHPQPIRSVPSPSALADPFIPGPPVTGGTASTMSYRPDPGFSLVYDPTLDPRQHDVAVSQAGEEVAVAILRAGEAFAFSTESYDHNAWVTQHGVWNAAHTALLYAFAAQTSSRKRRSGWSTSTTTSRSSDPSGLDLDPLLALPPAVRDVMRVLI
jgi:hypothetical protein